MQEHTASAPEGRNYEQLLLLFRPFRAVCLLCIYRFSEKEKQTIEQYAAACGLTRSEYLRKRALGYEPRPALCDSFFPFYSKLCDLCNNPMGTDLETALLELITDIRRELMLPRRQNKKEVIA